MLLKEENRNMHGNVVCRSMEEVWTLAPDFILRSTGFPISWIEPLRFTKTVEAINILLEVEQTLTSLRADLQEQQQSDWIQNRDDALRWSAKCCRRSNANRFASIQPRTTMTARAAMNSHWNMFSSSEFA